MENENTTVGQTHTNVFAEENLARAALGGGAVLIAGATGYMNVSGWVAQANDTAGAWVNGALATGMELGAAGGLAWAAYQLGHRRPLRAAFAGAVAGVLVYFNTCAAQNFIHVQHDRGTNAASAAMLAVDDAADEITRQTRELSAIERRNKGEPPRPVAALDAAATGLNPARRRDAALLRTLGEERALRVAYETAQKNIARLRAEKRDGHASADREVRTVMPSDHIVPFIWALEILKGSIFFILGGSDLGAVFRRRCAPSPESTPSQPKQQTAEDRAKWARRKGGKRSPAGA